MYYYTSLRLSRWVHKVRPHLMIGMMFVLKEMNATIVIQLKKKINPEKFLSFFFFFFLRPPRSKIPSFLDSEQGEA